MDTNELIRSTIIWDLENSLKKKDAEIERLQKQAHYHYENGLKKDVEIERLQNEVKELEEIMEDNKCAVEYLITKRVLKQQGLWKPKQIE